jgi:hypothetical protein
MKDLVSICIPIYKEFPNKNENISFNQCLKILSQYKIYICTFKELNIDYYTNILNSNKNIYDVKYFNNNYFRNIRGYNKLMLSSFFYKSFNNCEYLLIYQLDAFVFRDELIEWCKKRYSYIGAPWVIKKDNHLLLSDVGNGGFSLRNIKDHIRVLKTFTYIVSPYLLFKDYFQPGKTFKRYLYLILKFTMKLTFKNNTHFIFNDYELYEDYFWSKIACKKFNWFNIPLPLEAMKFSMELEPSYLFLLNNSQLPFGCHAWERYEPNFWRNHIQFHVEDPYVKL